MSAFNEEPVYTLAADFAKHLGELKKDAKTADAWWAPALTFQWSRPKPAGNGTSWVPIIYTDPNQVRSRLNLRILGERQSSQIMPVTADELAKLQARVKNPKTVLKARAVATKPNLSFNKWGVRVATAADDNFRALEAPDDRYLSAYYQAAELLDEAFSAEATLRIERGQDVVKELKRGKVTAAEVLTKAGARAMGDVIVSSDQFRAVSRDHVDALKRVALVAQTTKIASLVQRTIVDQRSPDAGRSLVNPIARVNLPLNKDNVTLTCALFDKKKPYTDSHGGLAYEAAKLDGKDIDNYNVHAFILPGSLVDGIVRADAVCFSNLAISLPVRLDIGVVERHEKKEINLSSIYGGAPAASAPGSAPSGAPSSASGSAPSSASSSAPGSASGSASSSASSSAPSSASSSAPAMTGEALEALAEGLDISEEA